jgi:nucleotide-binding universal stress UspA family protein
MFDHILVPLDGSFLAERVIPHSLALARVFGARLTLVRVLEESASNGHTAPVDPLEWHMHKAEAEAYLGEWQTRLQAAQLDVEAVVLEGQPAQRIIELADSQAADLILMSSHGQAGLHSWNVSSVVQKVILRANRSLMIVRAYEAPNGSMNGNIDAMQYARILAPLDVSQRAECAVAPAAALARFYDARLILAHVVARPEMPRRTPLTDEERSLVERLTERNREEATAYLEQLQSRLSGDADVETVLLVEDDVAASLHQLVDSQDVDLVVLSAHGYSGQSRWPYGRVTTNYVLFGSKPVLIVQDLPPDEIAPTRAEVAATQTKGH